MSTSFLRTTMRAQSSALGFFLPETPTRLYPGSDAFAVVMVGRLLSIEPGSEDVFIAREGPVTLGVFPLPDTTLGWAFHYDPPSAVAYLAITLNDGSQVVGVSRVFTARDVGKVHRVVGVCDVANSEVRCYVDGQPGGTIGVATSFLPSVAPDTYGVLGVLTGGSPANGVQSWEVCDLAVIDSALDADEVADLDVLIQSTGQLPPYQWMEHYRAEQLCGHRLVIDAGGRSAGRGWPTISGSSPVLGSVLIDPVNTWGGSGV